MWVGAFHDEGVASALGLAPTLRPLALMPVGHAAAADSPHDGEKAHEEAMRAGADEERAQAQARRVRRVPIREERDTGHDID